MRMPSIFIGDRCGLRCGRTRSAHAVDQASWHAHHHGIQPTHGPRTDQPAARTAASKTIRRPKPSRRARNEYCEISTCSRGAFSLNHGCVTALVALAASELGASLGNTTLFILYAFYTLSAAFLSNGLVARAGAKRTLVLSLGAYCVYVASYAVAFFTPMNRHRDRRRGGRRRRGRLPLAGAGRLFLHDQPKPTPTPRVSPKRRRRR